MLPNNSYSKGGTAKVMNLKVYKPEFGIRKEA